MIRNFASVMLVVCLALATAGCSRSPRITFYTLEPGTQISSAAAVPSGPAVVVGPVTLPELVDRPQFVVRVAVNRVDILETHRWAEPLKSGIPRVIAENLGRLLGSNRVSSYLHHSGADADYRVLVDFQRFELSPGEAVTVEAVWTLRRAGEGTSNTGRSVVREPVGGAGYDAMAAACGRALLAVSDDLAKAIRAEAAVER